EQLFNQAYTTVLPVIERSAPRPERIPLSFSQERLWFIDQLAGSRQYHVPAVLRLRGPLNVAALEYALQQTVERHEVLRTVYRQEAGQPYQHVREVTDWQLQQVDASEYENDEALQADIRQLINKTFDLAEDFMLRAAVIRINADEHILVVTLHHIASDGWSRSILVNDFTAFYAAFEAGIPAALPPVPVQYADFANWQRSYLEGVVLEEKLRFWKNKLQAVPALQLPTDYPRPAIQRTKGALHAFQLSKELAEKLQALGQQHNATVFMTLMSAFKVLLYRYSGQTDVCVGTPVAGRQQQEVEKLIGFFVNTLALRTQLNPTSSFKDLLQEERLSTLEAFSNQELPFEKVVEAVVKERDMSRSPIFQVMFVLLNTPQVPELVMNEIQFSRVQHTHTTSLFDLTLFITETPQGLNCSIEYCSDLFSPATIKRFAGHFDILLQGIVTDPAVPIARLPFLAPQEVIQVQHEFNSTAISFPADTSVIGLFEQQAKDTPDFTALVFEGNSLTYDQLNRQANQLANYLVGQGLKPGYFVPLSMERGLGMIVSVLAILKAGGIYVPADPEYPADRLRYMLEDTAASLVLSTRQSAAKLPVLQAVQVIYTDGEDREFISQQPETGLQITLPEDHLIYLLYTSGSTGRPKGVKMGGKGMVNLLNWQEKQFSNHQRRVLQFASLNFDVSFQEIFSTLCFGSTLFLIKEDRRRDMRALLYDIKQQQLTHLFIPYIVLKTLVESIEERDYEAFSLEEIIVAGEQLKLTDDIKALQQKTGLAIINEYGPTEAHVVSSYRIPAEGTWPALPPIGKPIDNTKLYILDGQQQLVPVGVPGELCIGGVQVAAGYHNLPQLTAEKFGTDQFNPGGRLYKTGDLARWLEDGNIEYLGRIDDQVKIRGYRVELGEIESVLQACPGVQQAAVLAKIDEWGGKRLVGYVVTEENFDRSGVVTWLKKQLPDYMIPSVLIALDRLPVTSNGKVDRKALPEPEAELLQQQNYTAPRTATEQMLADTWQRLLQVGRVGIDDNFFELGGHSLLAIRLVYLLNKNLKNEISIGDVFIHPTVAGLAAYIDRQAVGAEEEKIQDFKYLVPLKIGSPLKPTLYIICGGGGTALRFKRFAGLLDDDQSVYSFQPPIGEKAMQEFPDSIEKFAEVFISEMMASNPDGPYALSGHCVGGVIAFEMAKQLEAMGKKVVLVALFDTVIRERKRPQRASIKNLYNIPAKTKEAMSKTILKFDFETFLLRKHTAKAIGYKMKYLYYLMNNFRSKKAQEQLKQVSFEIFNESADMYVAATRKYRMSPYERELIVFYAKERYYFTDVNKNIRFKKVKLNEVERNMWKR
ncbi:MAG: amino acid adenylation domain-containing protein, partial [Bacteroidota bacterium]